MDTKNKAGVAQGLRNAEREKASGNAAIARKDRTKAVAHYTEAIECLVDASAQKPTDEEEKQLERLWVVCFANRAAAWLLEGPGQDAKKALDDATEAVKRDEGYAKG